MKVKSFFEIYLKVLRNLLNQSIRWKTEERLLTNIWGFVALILTQCFSSGILISLVIHDMRKIDSIADIISSGIKIYGNNNSWVWYQFDNELRYNNPIDKNLVKIKPRINYIHDNDKDYKVSLVI